MKIVYSNHAIKRMRQRDIEDWEIEHLLKFPSLIIKSFDNRKMAVGEIKNRRIGIVFIELENYIKIVTVRFK